MENSRKKVLGDLLAQCSSCLKVRVRYGKKEYWQHSIVKFEKLENQKCWDCIKNNIK